MNNNFFELENKNGTNNEGFYSKKGFKVLLLITFLLKKFDVLVS